MGTTSPSCENNEKLQDDVSSYEKNYCDWMKVNKNFLLNSAKQFSSFSSFSIVDIG